MSQNDFAIADQTFPAMLADLNSGFQALASLSSGAAAPPTTYPFQLWTDTTSALLKVRNGANNAWLTLAKLDPGTNQWEPRADIIQALTTAGVTIRNAAGTAIASFSNAGVLSGASITIGVGKTLDISAGTMTLANDQIDGAKVKAATDLLRGTVELATEAEAIAGIDTGRAMTPFTTKKAIAAIPAPAQTIVLISQTVISGSPGTADFFFDETLYDEITLSIGNLKTSGDNGYILLQLSDNGTTFEAGGTAYSSTASLNGAAATIATSAGYINVSETMGNATGEDGYSGTVRIIQPGLAKRTGVMASGRSDGTTAGNPQHHENTGSRKTSVATKGVRLYPISGTLASGTITMYGVLKP